MKPLAALNAGKPYAEQIKPFNFIISCHVREARPSDRRRSGALPSDRAVRDRSAAMGEVQWIDQYSGKRYRITASGPHGSRTVARVKSYGDVLREYEFHPEAKCADASGAPCTKQTVGLLGRRHVAIDSITYIGKESNRLEEVEEQSLLDPERRVHRVSRSAARRVGQQVAADAAIEGSSRTGKSRRLQGHDLRSASRAPTLRKYESETNGDVEKADSRMSVEGSVGIHWA